MKGEYTSKYSESGYSVEYDDAGRVKIGIGNDVRTTIHCGGGSGSIGKREL